MVATRKRYDLAAFCRDHRRLDCGFDRVAAAGAQNRSVHPRTFAKGFHQLDAPRVGKSVAHRVQKGVGLPMNGLHDGRIAVAHRHDAKSTRKVDKNVPVYVLNVCTDGAFPYEGVGIGGPDFGCTPCPSGGDRRTFASGEAVDPRATCRSRHVGQKNGEVGARGPKSGHGRRVIWRAGRVASWIVWMSMKRLAPVFALLACERTVTERIEGNNGEVEITLLNPTNCSDCDPWKQVDELRLDIVVDNEVVATDTFVYPEENPVLPELGEFGVVRVVLVGLSDGEVVSAGRTRLIPTGPGVAVIASMNFLPVNTVLPLSSAMVASRSLHTSVLLRDGTTLLVGGTSPGRDLVYEGMEIFDPGTGTFAPAAYKLLAPAFSPVVEFVEDGEVLFVGGGDVAGGTVVGSANGTALIHESGTTNVIGAMGIGRVGHCMSLFSDRRAAVFGGHTGESGMEFLSRSEEGDWLFTPLSLRTFDETRVSSCITLPDGQTYLQGVDAASTGLWAYNEGAGAYLDPGEAFVLVDPDAAGDAAAYVSGASLAVLEDGNVWIGGGARPEDGVLERQARRFNPVSLRFERAAAQPDRVRVDGVLRDWIEPDWKVWGCGYADAGRTSPESTIELFNVETGELGVIAGMDRVRNGCDVSTLPDGALLVSGGFDLGNVTGVGAGIVVPWRDAE